MYIHSDLLHRDHRKVDFLEAGSGPPVILVHSSMAGARQWSALIPELESRYHVRAVNLFGYGGTQAWQGPCPPSLDDYAELVLAAIPKRARRVSLVGHSLGGAVAMRAAQRLGSRVGSLVLIEPSSFALLRACRRDGAYAEVRALAEEAMHWTANVDPQTGAEAFIDYWCGRGGWDAMSESKRASIITLVARLPCEWAALLGDRTDLAALQRTLPSATLLISFENTVRPSRELVDILAAAFPDWLVATLAGLGHMGPLTHPHLVNPLIRGFLGLTESDQTAAWRSPLEILRSRA
jgi:pimeloyl-ACP methyl ester carboxylesterase